MRYAAKLALGVLLTLGLAAFTGTALAGDGKDRGGASGNSGSRSGQYDRGKSGDHGSSKSDDHSSYSSKSGDRKSDSGSSSDGSYSKSDAHSKSDEHASYSQKDRSKSEEQESSSRTDEHKSSSKSDERKSHSQKDRSKSEEHSVKSLAHEKITICHATGSATNPFVQITISKNGLHGHAKHQDGRDIIPAPAGGCPTAAAGVKGAEHEQKSEHVKTVDCVNGVLVATKSESKWSGKSKWGKHHHGSKSERKSSSKSESKLRGPCGEKPATPEVEQNTCPAGMAAVSDAHMTVVQGGTATATFTIHAACAAVQMSFVSYSTPWPEFHSDQAELEKLFDSKTEVLGAGLHTMTVSVPNCFYQVDLVQGPVIAQLGPSGTDNYYGAQNRRILAENGGTGPCAETTPAANQPTAATPQTAAATPAPAAPAPAAPAPATAAASVPASAPASAPAASAPAASGEAPTAAGVAGEQATLTSTKPAGGVLGASASLGKRVGAATLPFTGLPVWLAVLIALALIMAGVAARRTARGGA